MAISEKVLAPRLAEVGRIKIGGLGEKRKAKNGNDFQLPVRFDHFVITKMERGPDGNFARDEQIHKVVGDKPTELRVVLLANDPELNFRTELAFYAGAKCLCRGDGERAEEVQANGTRISRECPCPRLDMHNEEKTKCKPHEEKTKCKPHGVLSVILAESTIAGGVWRFSTTSWNTVRNLTSSLKFLSLCTGGKLAGIPLILRYYKKQATKPDGSPTTIGVVGLFFAGSTASLLDSAIQQEKMRIGANIQLETLEAQMRREVMANPGPVMDDDEAGSPEFHPNGDDEPADPHAPQAPADPLAAAIAENAKLAKEQKEETTVPTPVPAPAPTPVLKQEPASPPAAPPVAPPDPPAPVSPSAPPVEPPPNGKSRDQWYQEILAARSSQKALNSAQFKLLCTKTIGRPDPNADNWTDEELPKMVEAIKSWKAPANGNGGASNV